MKSDKNNTNEHFNIPEDYFASFENRLYTELKFQELYPIKVNAFSVPDAYFEKVQTAIISKNTPQGKLINYDFKTLTKAFVALAALIALVFYVVNPIDNSIDFESISVSSIENYLIDENQLPYYFSDEELTTIEDNTSIFDEQFVNEDVIYEYVDQEIIKGSWNADQ